MEALGGVYLYIPQKVKPKNQEVLYSFDFLLVVGPCALPIVLPQNLFHLLYSLSAANGHSSTYIIA